MISIRTNTRGMTKMSNTQEPLTGRALVDAFNALAAKRGVPPVKRFADNATGQKRLAALSVTNSMNETKSVKTMVTEKRNAEIAKDYDKIKVVVKGVESILEKFEARVGTKREKLLIKLIANLNHPVKQGELLRAVYGSANVENVGALSMTIKGALGTIAKKSLPFSIERNKKENTYALVKAS